MAEKQRVSIHSYSYSPTTVEIQYSDDSKSISYYDSEHKLTKKESVQYDTVSSVTTYQYDTLGREIQSLYTYLSDSAKYSVKVTHYDDSLNLKTIVETDHKLLDDSVRHSVEVEYLNEAKKPYKNEGQMTKDYRLLFYNAHGDLVSVESYNRDNKLEMLIETKIQYWK